MRQIYLFTDFGYRGPYVGQMHARLAGLTPGKTTVIDLMHDAPCQDPRSSAYLLAALVPDMPSDAICVAVVDPGVGTSRMPVVLEVGGRTFVGPDNGLLNVIARRQGDAVWRRLDWRPDTLSQSFHGRDLFAPTAGYISAGGASWLNEWTTLLGPGDQPAGEDWPDALPAVIYIDAFGNAMTGLTASTLSPTTVLRVGETRLQRAGTFGDVVEGVAFWYENSIGLAEIAVNQGSAAEQLSLGIGSPITED